MRFDLILGFHIIKEPMAAPQLPLSFIPPPPGVKSNFANPQSQTAGTVALHAVCLFLVTCCVSIRLYTKKFIGHEIGLDDWKYKHRSLKRY